MGMLFKVLSAVLLVLAAGVGFAKENYQVVLLGDLHYDSADLRTNVDKLKPHHYREMNRNMAAWKKNIPAVLKAAADYANKNNVLFTVQCGDITQGDEGKYQFAATSFERVLNLVNKDHSKPVYVVRGNHDVRGAGKEKACRDVLFSYMKKQDVLFPKDATDQTSYKVVGKDLFIFFDGMKDSLKSVETALQAKPDARHIFLVTHIPVMPCQFSPSGIGWICGKYSNVQNGNKIRALLAKHNVIVLTAHIHRTTYFDWKLPEGSIKQFTSFSIVADPAAKPEKVEFTGEEYFKHFAENFYPKQKAKDRKSLHDFLQRYMGKLNGCIDFKRVTGFNVLRIDGDKVFVDMYCGKLDKAAFTQQIK